MAMLNIADVRAGKAMPKPGDVVMGKDGFPYKYMQGNPLSNDPGTYAPLTGTDYLNSLPVGRKNFAMAVLSGKAPYPATSRNNKFNQQVLADVRNAEPDFDATAWKRRVDMIHDFTSGPSARIIAALNQAPLHALTLADSYDQLHNLSTGGHWLNDFLTNAQAATGDLKQQAGMGAFNASQPAVADELATIYKGGPGTIEGIQSQQQAFPMGATPGESNSALRTASELLRDRLYTYEQRWQNGMGTAASMFPIISPRSRAALDTLYNRYHPAEAAANRTPAPNTGTPAALPMKQVGRFQITPGQ